jgi:hypothetical protein
MAGIGPLCQRTIENMAVQPVKEAAILSAPESRTAPQGEWNRRFTRGETVK